MNTSKTNNQDTIVIVSAKRTAFGAFGGSFKDQSATDLGVFAAKAALEEAKVSPELIDHVIFGNVVQTSSDAAYLARHIGLRCGTPISVPALTLNRLCGSGFEAIADGVRRIRLGEATTVLVGGTENMSQSPYVLRGARFGYRMGNGELEDSLTAGLTDSYAGMPMAMTAEALAVKYGISRAEVDTFALASQKKTAAALAEDRFKAEIAPVTLTVKGKPVVIDKDEHSRPDASLESLAKLKPVFKKDGVVTAGNASGICDGAAALIVTTKKNATDKGWPVLATWIDSAVVGCDPKEMGLGPVFSSQKLFAQVGIKIPDIKFFEVNEAFAAQVLAVQKEIKFPEDKLNVDGGAIAIGHPLGTSGARITAHLIHRLRASGGGLGLGSACIGGGQGISVLIQV